MSWYWQRTLRRQHVHSASTFLHPSFAQAESGDEDRDEAAEDYTFSASSRTTYVAQQIVFAGVMADARMVERVFDYARFGIPLDRQRGRRDRWEVV